MFYSQSAVDPALGQSTQFTVVGMPPPLRAVGVGMSDKQIETLSRSQLKSLTIPVPVEISRSKKPKHHYRTKLSHKTENTVSTSKTRELLLTKID
jgi:hypothetical protein